MCAIRDCSPDHVGDHAGPGVRAHGFCYADGEAGEDPLPGLRGERLDGWQPWPGTQVGA